jgi:putative transposase
MRTDAEINGHRRADHLRAAPGRKHDAPADVCRQLGVREATFYNWKKKYAHLGVSELRRLRSLRDENARLKRLVADLTLDKHMLADALRKRSEAARRREGPAPGPTERWSMDFVHDASAIGRAFRLLTVVDQLSRQSPLLEVASSISAHRSAWHWRGALVDGTAPRSISVDHPIEFMSRALEDWALPAGCSSIPFGRESPWKMPSSRPSTGA